MNKKTTQLILIIFLVSFAVPNLVFASWWNPFSWSWFSRSAVVETAQVITAVETLSQETEAKETTEILKTDSVPLRPTTDVPVVAKPTILPCDQDCMNRRELSKRQEEEARKQNAIILENQRINSANLEAQNRIVANQNEETPPQSLQISGSKSKIKKYTGNREPIQTMAYSNSACLAQKQSYLSEVDSAYLTWYDQLQEVRKQLDSCYTSNPIPLCDKEMSNMNGEWQVKITATMKAYHDKLTQCAPENRNFADISKVIPSPY